MAWGHRPSLLLEAETLARAGTARQMAFDFAAGYAAPASRSQHLAWERHLVGYPLEALRPWLAESSGATRRHTALLAEQVPRRRHGGWRPASRLAPAGIRDLGW